MNSCVTDNAIGDIKLVGLLVHNTENGTFLVEDRPDDACIYAGERRVLGGHIRSNESSEKAAYREICEELGGTKPNDLVHVCRGIDVQGEKLVTIDFYGFGDWDGELANPEGKQLYWALPDSKNLVEMDKCVMKSYLSMMNGH